MGLGERIRRAAYNMSFRRKMLLVMVFAIILPTLAVELAIMSAMRGQALEFNTRAAISSAVRTEQQLQEMFKQVVDVSNMLYVDEGLLNIVSRRYISPWDVVNAMRHYTGFNYYLSYYPQIKSIRFYISDKNLFGEYAYVNTTKQLENYSWYQNTVANDGLVCWNYTFSEAESQPNLSLTRLVRNFEGVDVGVLVIELDKGYMSGLLAGDSFQTLLTDGNDLILAASNEEYPGKSLKTIGYVEKGETEESGVYECELDGAPSISTVKRFHVAMLTEDLSILSVFPSGRIIAESNSAIYLYLVIIVSGELMAVALIIWFSRRMARRVGILRDELHIVALGNLETEITVDGGDEIGQLSRDFRIMKESLRELIDAAYISKLQAKQLELMEKESKYNMLVSQLNPHFLFNALETIRMKALTDNNHEVSRYVTVLGKILRTSLGMESFIKLSRELDFVTNYLTFQMFRFQNKLEFEINLKNVDPDVIVIPFLIQPVVENSVIHGVEPKRGKCQVRVTAEEAGENLCITVADSGRGMDAEQLERLWDGILAPEPLEAGKSIGLRNVYHRIKLYYGEEYGFTIQSGENEGTRVVIRIPAGANREES